MCFVSTLFNALCSIPHIEFSMVHTDVYHVLHTVVSCRYVLYSFEGYTIHSTVFSIVEFCTVRTHM